MNKRLENIVKKLKENPVITVRKDVVVKLINEVDAKSVKLISNNGFSEKDATIDEINSLIEENYDKVSCSANIRCNDESQILVKIILNPKNWVILLFNVENEKAEDKSEMTVVEIDECFVGIDIIKKDYFNDTCHNAVGKFFMGTLKYKDAIKIINDELNPKGIYIKYKYEDVKNKNIIIYGECDRGKAEFFFEDISEVEDLILFELSARKHRYDGFNKTYIEIPYKNVKISKELDKDYKVINLLREIRGHI